VTQDTPSSGRTGNLFAAAFGRQRGRPEGTEEAAAPLTRRERAQQLADWIERQAKRTDRLARVRDENHYADELGLLLEHGIWKPFTADGNEADLAMCSLLTFVYDQDDPVDCIAIIDVDSAGHSTVFASVP
jgi:hypothetical protein